MVFALDTNTVSYYMRRQGSVVPRLQALSPSQLALPSVVIFEVAFGLRREVRQAALDGFERLAASIQTLDFDADAADHAASIRVELEDAGTPIGLADLLIAATARRHGCTLVTHNTREFSRISGLALVDWY